MKTVKILAALVALTLAACTDATSPAVEQPAPMPLDAAEVHGHLPTLNSAGDHVYAELYIRDGTGSTNTPSDGGIATVISGAPVVVGEGDGSGCYTASLTTGLVTVAARCGVGEAVITVCIPNVHAGNTAKTHTFAIAKNGTVLTTAPTMVKTEPVDAGAQSGVGCTTTVQDLALADTIGAYHTTSGATAEAVTIRDLVLRVEKVLNK